jgi:hypothetical protein
MIHILTNSGVLSVRVCLTFGRSTNGERNVPLSQIATECGAQHAQGVQIYGLEGSQGFRTLLGSLHPASSVLRILHTLKAKHKQYTHHHPIFQISTSISTPSTTFSILSEKSL